jgi:hypothetical protein
MLWAYGRSSWWSIKEISSTSQHLSNLWCLQIAPIISKVKNYEDNGTRIRMHNTIKTCPISGFPHIPNKFEQSPSPRLEKIPIHPFNSVKDFCWTRELKAHCNLFHTNLPIDKGRTNAYHGSYYMPIYKLELWSPFWLYTWLKSH